MPHLTFWYDLASNYSYLSAMRIEAFAAAHGVTIEWQPFLLGPIFRAQGWNSSPFNVYPAKGRYMRRDVERIAAARQIPFVMPKDFPANSLKAARIVLAAAAMGEIAAVTKAIYTAGFARGEDIGNEAVLRAAVASASSNVDEIFASAASVEVKDALRAAGTRAEAAGIFGAPSFTASDGELFWGDDRLEAAITWEAKL
jgi:2-hydroxychromene-2-carboxylate isomerase